MCFGKICMNHSTVNVVQTRLKILRAAPLIVYEVNGMWITSRVGEDSGRDAMDATNI